MTGFTYRSPGGLMKPEANQTYLYAIDYFYLIEC